MANDRTIKSMRNRATQDTVLNHEQQDWYQGNCFSDQIAPPKISPELKDRILGVIADLSGKGLFLSLGVCLGVPHLAIIREHGQWPRMIVIFGNENELRNNNSLRGMRHHEELLATGNNVAAAAITELKKYLLGQAERAEAEAKKYREEAAQL